MNDAQYDILDAALSGMSKGPRPLAKALAAAPEQAGIAGAMSEEELRHRLGNAQPDDAIRNRLRRSLVTWDFEDESTLWVGDVPRNTSERRRRIYDLLALKPATRDLLDASLPFAPLQGPTVISGDFVRWYDEEVRRRRNFYWSAYVRYLDEVRDFDELNIQNLDDATNSIVERLSNPERTDPHQARGLVVGHVQSGKTANFTGVIAKAIDAGYRLVVVLSGTMDLLRDQTQRRIDMELVGKELIRRSADPPSPGERWEYDDDPAWSTGFISHLGRPSELGAFDIERLTGAGKSSGGSGDFQSLRMGIRTLEIEKVDKQKPLIDPVNLHPAAVRLVVVKKNAARLGKLVKDLEKIGPRSLSEVPALIIDDESDQASVNTIRPDPKFLKEEKKRRTAINEKITTLLVLLPRAQYVGYTATPFANVFVDPDDAKGIFPRDFIIALPRPIGYMGVSDFHDIDPDREPAVRGMANEKAFVRGVVEPHDELTEQLQRAIDTFVLTGAIKLYRTRLGACGPFSHHTMLVHESQLQAEHDELRKLVTELWNGAGYDGGAGPARLRALLDDDILPVSKAHRAGLPVPTALKEIRKEIGETIRRVSSDGPPVLLVNGTSEADTPDFDKKSVWRIIVGGAKLSRGYTVEGLTVSYFRRRARYQDTLMQMGRWFGFRPGYEDLVRLYIGRHEPLTGARKQFIDLYDAFEAISRDEETFRTQLSRYALPSDGSPPLKPIQVPPLVANSHPQLKPAARNKMFNAILKAQNFAGQWVARTLSTDVPTDLEHNRTLFKEFLEDGRLERSELAAEVEAGGTLTPVAMDALWCVVGHQRFVQALTDYRWAEPDRTSLLNLELEYLRGGEAGDPKVDDWLILFPQVKKSQGDPWRVGEYETTTIRRALTGTGRYNVFTTSEDVKLAEYLVGARTGVSHGRVKDLQQPRRRGVLLLYAVYPIGVEQDVPTMGFSFRPPENDLPKRVMFTVARPDDPDEVVVDRV